MNFEEYLQKNLDRNVIDHVLRASPSVLGHPKFYIYPAGADGDTPDFLVDGNNLIPFEKGDVVR